MSFHYLIGEDFIRQGIAYNHRQAVRAVICRDDQILMLLNARGDYKLPGGGIEAGENHHQALRREIEEETGYGLAEIGSLLGTSLERRLDAYEEGLGFQMLSTYYACRLSEDWLGQKLSESERALGFRPEWVTKDHALAVNAGLLKADLEVNPWVIREVRILQHLIDAERN